MTVQRKAYGPDKRPQQPPSASQGMDRKAFLKAVSMLISEERAELDAELEGLRKTVDTVVDRAETSTSKALGGLVDRLDRFSDRTATIEAKRAETDRKMSELLASFGEKSARADKQYGELMEANKFLRQRVKELTEDSLQAQVVPQLLATNLATLRAVCDAILHKKAKELLPLQRRAVGLPGWKEDDR